MERLANTFESIKNRWKELKRHQQIVIISVAALVMGGLITLSFWSSSEDYVLLYENLSDENLEDIKVELSERNVSFEVREGNSLWAPVNMESKLRMEMSLLGLPKKDDVYDDIFGNKQLGDTYFDHTVKEREALRRNLKSAIESLNPIRSAIVNITPIDESPFIRGEKPAKAVVQLRLHPGRKLTANQVKGIIMLVVNSVKGLAEENVTILDNDGNILRPDEGETETDEANWRLEYQRKQERDLKQKIIEVLTPTVGPGGVRAEVTVECDFDEMEQTDEKYDSEESAILREKKEDETKQGTQPSGLPPGTASNVTSSTTIPQGNQNQPMSSSKNSSETDYQPSKTIIRTKNAPGKIKRITASVTIDNKKVIGQDGKITSEAWKPADITKLEDAVRNAIGLDPKRGDTVSVANLPFDTTTRAMAQKEIKDAERWQRYMTLFKIGAVAAVGLMLLYLIRSVFKTLRIGEEVVPAALGPGTGTLVIGADEEERALLSGDTTVGALTSEEEEEEEIPEEPEPSEDEIIEQEVIGFVDDNPELVVRILQDWLDEDVHEPARAKR